MQKKKKKKKEREEEGRANITSDEQTAENTKGNPCKHPWHFKLRRMDTLDRFYMQHNSSDVLIAILSKRPLLKRKGLLRNEKKSF